MPAKEEVKGTIKSVKKALILLKKILSTSEEVSIGELQKEFGINQSTIHHLMKTLKVEGFVSQSIATRRYTIGPELFNLWVKQNNLTNYFYRSFPVLEDVVSKLNETTSLFIRREHEAICVIGKESRHTLKASLRIGRHIPLHCTATGKVFLAYLDEETVNQIIYRSGLHKYMPNTITKPDILFNELDQIKKHGYALELEEYEDMINAVGVPIFNNRGEVILVMTQIAPLTRMDEKQISTVIPYLNEKAKNIEMIFSNTEF